MTKYILHGGETGRKSDDNKKFFAEITRHLSDSDKILCVNFARPKDDWEELFEADQVSFAGKNGEKSQSLVLASDKTSAFVEQLKKAKAIYLRGGNTHILKEYLDKVDDLESLFEDKIVAGSSAGALVLSRYFYENDDEDNPFNEGLGILPFKTFCHYSDEKSDKLEELKKYGEDTESVLTIKEEKFFIIEKERGKIIFYIV